MRIYVEISIFNVLIISIKIFIKKKKKEKSLSLSRFLESIQLTTSILIFKEDVHHVGNQRINNTKNYSNYMQFAIYMQDSLVDKGG